MATKGYNTAILERKKRPNRLIVDDGMDYDNSVVSLNSVTMETHILRGDIVLVKCKQRRGTACVVINNEHCEETKIRMSRVVRTNLRVCFGDIVSIRQCNNIKNATWIQILPTD